MKNYVPIQEYVMKGMFNFQLCLFKITIILLFNFTNKMKLYIYISIVPDIFTQCNIIITAKN